MATTTKKDGNKPSKWKDSEAKMLLQQDILDGKVTASMKPKEVFEMRAEYKVYGMKNFRPNLYSLRSSISANQQKADSDAVALVHDRRIHPKVAHTPKGYPRWDGSEAQRLLKEDMESSGTNRFEPSVLRETRPEYEVFPLKVFRDHIYQEARMKTGSSYWMNKAKEKKLTKTAPTTKPSSNGASSG
jgi:hypothetical protein